MATIQKTTEPLWTYSLDLSLPYLHEERDLFEWMESVAMLSLQYDMYVSACREVADIYIVQGYSLMLIASWL